MTKLSDVVRMAEASASKKAIRVDTWTQKDGSHVVDITFKDGKRKEMHAPPGPLEMDWQSSQGWLEYQRRISPFRA